MRSTISILKFMCRSQRLQFRTTYSTQSDAYESFSNFNHNFFEINENRKRNYSILNLKKHPGNSLSFELLNELNSQLNRFENSRDLNGVILTSDISGVFSSGFDLNELSQCKEEDCKRFWYAFQEFWIRLYGSRKIYVAAINGDMMSAGCLIGLSCDYRLMTDGNFRIGFNENLTGVKSVSWFRTCLINTIGFRESEKALQLAKLYTPREAVRIRLVDELCNEKDLLMKAEEKICELSQIPIMARQTSKLTLRAPIINKLIENREHDLESFVKFATKQSIQNYLKSHLSTITKQNKIY